jgi:quinolinate synthase
MQQVVDEIKRLQEQKDALIVAHYYQDARIKRLADFVGDSLELSKRVMESNAKIVVFAGVHFMAETAKIMNPEKKILLPDLSATCSLALGCPADSFAEFLQNHEGKKVLTYINSSAEVKAMSDLICTSSNALKMLSSFDSEEEIVFGPDKNLGQYLAKMSQRKLVLWEGACVVHEAFSIGKLLDLAVQYPEAQIIAHPESEAHILQVASFIGSTSALLQYVNTSPCQAFLVATEVGILDEMQQAVPHKVIIPVPTETNNSCACSECAYMKVNTVEKIFQCLLHESPEITLEESVRRKALVPLQKMFELSV